MYRAISWTSTAILHIVDIINQFLFTALNISIGKKWRKMNSECVRLEKDQGKSSCTYIFLLEHIRLDITCTLYFLSFLLILFCFFVLSFFYYVQSEWERRKWQVNPGNAEAFFFHSFITALQWKLIKREAYEVRFPFLFFPCYKMCEFRLYRK